jgi:FhaA, N-terminal domain/FHA domain
MGLQRFERRLERLVEGAFTKAFRSGLQPVEIGRRLVRELDAGRTLGVRGTVVPNRFVVSLAPEDSDRFAGFIDVLQRELQDAVREHARDEDYHFIGPVEVLIDVDERRKRGDMKVVAEIVEAEGGMVGALVLPDGRRVQLGQEPALIGRLPECAVSLSDPQVSRHHAEVRPDRGGYRVVDLGSMNGTLVNGTRISEHPLRDGDTIVVGATSIRYEES